VTAPSMIASSAIICCESTNRIWWCALGEME
jgi:hypothetical protein